MPSLRRWLNLPPAEKRLFVAAAAWVITFRFALSALPLRLVWKLARHSARPNHRIAAAVDFDQVNRAVSRAARYVPRATCLTQALTTHALLGRRGVMTQLRIGITKEPASGELLAHAWLEHDGKVLMTTETVDSFQAFPAIQLHPTPNDSQLASTDGTF